ncbi:hypothetical protein, conserved [Babesia ovata]|uniref:Extracellular matrix-binding ebh n=1 Tax=Babesia ovata TaxID=189622 RepID=A0A2H6KIV8_9APIC|nr:uncharacterized protein BOVATA_044090 [Babesia ovata]GBE62916.1 hypothetical protein, conserved [Babesia ovata]
MGMALKKLIEGAIQSATKSLNDRKEQLECPETNGHPHCKALKDQIATANEPEKSKKKSVLKKHYDEVHYLTDDARGRALDDIDARRISLGKLAGQLGGFIGKSDAVTNAINNAITTIIDSNEDFKSLKMSPSSTALSSAAVSAEPINDDELEKEIQHYEALKKPLEDKKSGKNPPLSSEESRLLSSHQSKLDALQRLKSLNESLSSLNNQQSDNCKKLLDNLCSGLEKFLGYQETSKGYDGSGIVYSDLDRLCDGVMAFLHGVLSGVKDDDNVKHYFPVTEMDKILQEIQASMHQKGALGTWDGEVTGKTERVKDYFNNINAVTIKHFNTSLSELSGCGPGEVADKLGNCFIHADAILNAFKLAESYYSDLDPKLGDKLKDSIYKIHVQVAKFHGAATNTELRNLLDCSARQLNAISEFVAKRAAQRLSELQAYLRDEIGVVESNLDGLRSNKFKELQNALYQDLHKAFKEVEGGITSVISKYDNKIFQPVGIIKSASDSFKTEINETRISLQEAIQVVEGEIRKLENFRDLESIGASLKGTVQLLSAINSDPFDRVKSISLHLKLV